MKRFYLILFLCVSAFSIYMQGCQQLPTENFALEEVHLENEIMQIPYRDVSLPLPLPPPPSGGKDPRRFAYNNALKGYASLFITHSYPLGSPSENYTYVSRNYYVATFAEHNRILREHVDFSNEPYHRHEEVLLDDEVHLPVAYRADCETIVNHTCIVRAQLQQISWDSFHPFLVQPIEICTSAIVLFTKDYIYIKSYTDKCFRRYRRQPGLERVVSNSNP